MKRYCCFLSEKQSALSSKTILLDAEESHHLLKVLRAPLKASITVLDGEGHRFHCCLEAIVQQRAELSIQESFQIPRPRPQIHLFQAVINPIALELVLRTATELGASVIHLFPSQHSTPFNLDSKMVRWSSILKGACKQSNNPFLLQIHLYASFVEVLDHLKGHLAQFQLFVASLQASSQPIAFFKDWKILDHWGIWIGPEGDFTSEEYCALSDLGAVHLQLTQNILRAETAALYSLTALDLVRQMRKMA